MDALGRLSPRAEIGGPESRQLGFTLIEVLIVMLVMGLCAGLVGAMAMPDDRAVLGVESERLAQLLDLAASESTSSGKAVSWRSDGSGYRFLRLSNDASWAEVRGIDSLRSRTLPTGMRIAALRVEAAPMGPAFRLDFLAQGDARAFDIQVAYGSTTAWIVGSPVGRVRVVREGGPAHAISSHP
jgi:general secretion pathway protein H